MNHQMHLYMKKNTRISGRDMFGKWGNILYNIKKEGGIAGKVSKALLGVSYVSKKMGKIMVHTHE